MTRDEAVEHIKRLCGYRTTGDTDIIAFLQQAQGLMETAPELPEFLRSERSYITTQAGEERIPVPNDFLRETEESALWYVPESSAAEEKELIKDDIDFLRVKYPRTQKGVPLQYALDNDYFRLFPTPDKAYLMYMTYYQRAALLTSNIENRWLKRAPWLLIGRAGSLYAGSIRDATAETKFNQVEQDAQVRMDIANEASEHANRRYVMGGEI